MDPTTKEACGLHGDAMSRTQEPEPLAVFHREVFVTSTWAGTANKPEGPVQVEIWYQAHGANLVIAMGAADAEAVAEELLHAAARARDRDAQRTNKGRPC